MRNATEAINLVALSWGEQNINNGDRILISSMEHHSNIVPWQLLAERKGAVLDYISLKDNAYIDMDDLKEKLGREPKLVALTHVSNVLGTINDVKGITRLAHDAGAKVLIDAAQSVPHMNVNVKDIGCDFFAFSSHKMLGPSGIGVLHAGENTLDEMEPVYGGGEMIRSVSFKGSAWNELPWKFEAGTQNIEGAIGFGAALEYLNRIGMDDIEKHERKITEYAINKLKEINGIKIYGPNAGDSKNRSGIISFSIYGIHPHDVSQVFDSEGIAIRSGHHCAMPLVKELLGEAALSRMSFYLYTDINDIDAAVNAIAKAKEIFTKSA